MLAEEVKAEVKQTPGKDDTLPDPSGQPATDAAVEATGDILEFKGYGVRVLTQESLRVLNPLRTFLQKYMAMSLESKTEFSALDRISGYLKTGEITLLIGPPGSGKTTLLRALSGQLNVADVSVGEILVNGESVDPRSQDYRRYTRYLSSRDDDHFPLLLVRETLDFVAQLTATEERVDDLLEGLGLAHVAETVVGGKELKGVSGGQKRRVSVGEALLCNATFYLLDSITNGLDSLTSFSLVQAIGEQAKGSANGQAYGAMISLLQPSDELIKLFKNIMVMNTDGTLAYFGPVDTVEAYFSSIVKRDASISLNDYILATVKNQRVDFDPVAITFPTMPSSAESFQSKVTGSTPGCPGCSSNRYSISRWTQLSIVLGRRLKLLRRNPMTYARVGIAVVFGLVVGSLFSVTQNDLIGSLGKQGFLFLSQFLVLMLSAAITLPSNFRQRQVYFKHKSAELYSDVVYYLGSLIVLEVPLSIVEALVLSLIPYFWIGLTPGADRYFYFFGILFGLECVGQSFSRLMAACTRTDVLANTLTTLYIFISGAISGFMPSYQMIGWWFRWYSWLNPVAYAYEGVMLNQFVGTSLNALIVGEEDQFRLGNITGEDYIATAADLPRISWGSTAAIKALNLGILFVFAIVFDTIGFIRMRSSMHRYSHSTRRPRSFVADAKVNPSTSHETTALSRQRIKTLEVRNLSYAVSVGGCASTKEKTLLHSVSAAFRCGRLTALMGESGAGKTTLLDVIAGYKTGGTIGGDVLLDGRPKDSGQWQRVSGYAEQLNILNPYLSVLETLMFTARCAIGQEEADNVVTDVLELMDLKAYASYAVGREDYDEGLEKGERKRLVVAVEMVKQPSILFLDEPTTGLDSISAFALMEAVKRSTVRHELIAIATIHSPSAHLFSLFDDLLLLEKGGHLVYTGTSSEAILHFDQLLSNANLPVYDHIQNPADFVISSIETLRNAHVPRLFNEAPEAAEDASKQQAEARKGSNNACKIFGVLLGRQVLSVWRNPSYFAVRLASTIVGAIFVGLLFLNLNDTINGAVFSIAAIFYSVFLFVIPMQASVVPLIEDRAVLYRETVSGLYNHLSYAMALLIVDLPGHVLNALLYYLLFYFSVGFDLSADRMGYFFLMIFMANWLLSSIGQMFAFLSPNAETANGLAGLSVILSVLLMGFLISVFAMPEAWRWAYWANSLHYVLQGLCENQLAGKFYTLPIDINIDPNITSLAIIIEDPQRMQEQLNNLFAILSNNTAFVPIAPPNTTILDPAVVDLLKCFAENDCFQSAVAVGICTALQCRTEVQAAGDSVAEIIDCVKDESLDDAEKGLCVLGAILSDEWRDEVLEFFRVAFKVVVFLLDVITKGIPGELILYFFGWARLDNDAGTFVADYKWYYCLFAVAIFVLSLEILKLIFIRYVSWVKR